MAGENPMNYFRKLNATITPQEFELLCLGLLQQTKDFSNLSNISVEHNKIYKAHDGTYQLDGYLEYTALGVKMKVIVECKLYKQSIKRDAIVVLHNKLQSIGAHKGIFMSSSGFQYGAVEYAKIHGIALIQVVDGSILTIQNSANPNIELLMQRYRNMPKHVALMYDLYSDFPSYRLPHGLEQFLTADFA